MIILGLKDIGEMYVRSIKLDFLYRGKVVEGDAGPIINEYQSM